MVAPNKRRPVKFAVPWHSGFVAMLPTIRSYAQGAFAHLDPDLRQDLTQEVIANCLVAYVRLFRRGRVALAFPTVLAKYGIAQVNDGRRVGNRLNVREVLSRYAQKHKGFKVERLDHFDEEENQWCEAVVQDTKTAPVPDIVAFRCDFADWLGQPESTIRGFHNGRVAGHEFVKNVPYGASAAVGFGYGATESVVSLLATPVNALLGWATRAIGCGGRAADGNNAETEMA